MRTPIMKSRIVFCCLFVLLGSCTLTAIQAEVGASLSEPGGGRGSAGSYILGAILDDIDPVTYKLWLRSNPDTSTRFVLNDNGYDNGDGRPSLLVTGAPRTQLVAWARNSAQGYDVVLSRFEAAGWTTPEVLAGNTTLDELDPSLVLDPATGDIHMFYWVNDTTPRVMHRQTDSTLSSWSTPVQVSSPAGAACRPGGIFHNGVLRVAYEVHDYGFNQTPRQVVVARQDASSWIPEVVAISYQTDTLRPELHSHNGVMWVDWIDRDDAAAWTRMDGEGSWEPVAEENYSGLEELEFHVRGAIRALMIN
jgi:hypothetical protein